MTVIDSFSNKYWFLSNFYPCGVTFNDINYLSTEHGYQAEKSTDETIRRLIANAPTAHIAKKLGRKVKLRDDWEDVKIDVMRELLRVKFQIPELRKRLLATGMSELIEGNYWGDTFWGVCEGKGENHLGKLLMALREELRAEDDLRSGT